ncbi:MAG TPA: glycine C-acetyltransferase [Oligoflexia bacterium]|nr:glycine C-acetyltransferase [Oligoflexia bacterium]HMP27001.1 glycine C-acetyltransferase [Oligoflexia bacterium]
MFDQAAGEYSKVLEEIRGSGLYKSERVIDSPQSNKIRIGDREYLNFCANNYLGLANDADLKEAAKRAIDEYGFGLASVRFICGTQTIHKELEMELAKFLGFDDAILYASCFDANGGLFEVLLGENDAVVSDALNHASIIDGIRLSKAKRFRYLHNDMNDLEGRLKEARAAGAKKIIIATDGVFSMDGEFADLKTICDLAERYSALVMVDECHATGFIGASGRGTAELCGVEGRVDIVTSTLGKALGGAVGGFVVARREIIDLLRQRSRPYLFSNSLPPPIVGASLAALARIKKGGDLRTKLAENTRYFRGELTKLNLVVKGDSHPIVPIMIGDAKLAAVAAEKFLERGIYVIAFSYPVVPVGEARIRTQISAAHSRGDIDRLLEAVEFLKDLV